MDNVLARELFWGQGGGSGLEASGLFPGGGLSAFQEPEKALYDGDVHEYEIIGEPDYFGLPDPWACEFAGEGEEIEQALRDEADGEDESGAGTGRWDGEGTGRRGGAGEGTVG